MYKICFSYFIPYDDRKKTSENNKKRRKERKKKKRENLSHFVMVDSRIF